MVKNFQKTFLLARRGFDRCKTWPKSFLAWFLRQVTFWPILGQKTFLNVRMHATSCQLTMFYDFTSISETRSSMKPLMFYVGSFWFDCDFYTIILYQWTYPLTRLSQGSFRHQLSQGTFLVFILFCFCLFFSWIFFHSAYQLLFSVPVKCTSTIFILSSLIIRSFFVESCVWRKK